MMARVTSLSSKWLVGILIGCLVSVLTLVQHGPVVGWRLSLFDLWEASTAGVFIMLTIAQSAATGINQSKQLQKETESQTPGSFAEWRAPLAPIQNLFWLATAFGAPHLRPLYMVTSSALLIANTLVLVRILPWMRMKRSIGLRTSSSRLFMAALAFLYCSTPLAVTCLFFRRDIVIRYHHTLMLTATASSVMFIMFGLGSQLITLIRSRSAIGIDCSVHGYSVMRGVSGVAATHALMQTNYWFGLAALSMTLFAVILESGILWCAWCYNQIDN